jgi:hypothetical protein
MWFHVQSPDARRWSYWELLNRVAVVEARLAEQSKR